MNTKMRQTPSFTSSPAISSDEQSQKNHNRQISDNRKAAGAPQQIQTVVPTQGFLPENQTSHSDDAS